MTEKSYLEVPEWKQDRRIGATVRKALEDHDGEIPIIDLTSIVKDKLGYDPLRICDLAEVTRIISRDANWIFYIMNGNIVTDKRYPTN